MRVLIHPFLFMKILKDLKLYQYIIIAIAVAINVFIIVNSCLPGKESSEESGLLVRLLVNIINAVKDGTINDNNIGAFSNFVRKFIGHFSLFCASGLFTTLSIKYLYYDNEQNYGKFINFSCISGIFLAILTEFIQYFVPGRSGEIKDVRIDSSGYLLSTFIVLLIIYILIKNRKNKIKGIK